MTDEILTGVLKGAELRVLVAIATDVSRHARNVHRAEPGAAELFAEAVAAGALLAGVQLQKGPSRVNLQLECDGALRGLFVDAGTDGSIRGYVKNPLAAVQGNRNAFRYRPLLGNSGFLSVLRDQGQGEFYRSSVQLEAFELAADLERFFTASEQLPAAVLLDVAPREGEDLGLVAGVLIQPFPDGDRQRMAEERERLRSGDFQRALESVGAADVTGLAHALFPAGQLEVTHRQPLQWKCSCSRERMLDAVQSTGPTEIADMLEKDGKAEVTCTFCSTVYVVTADELRAMLGGAQA